MAAVQDPNFWRRFSTAVHQQEDFEKAHPDLQHSYVGPSPVPSAPMSPLSQCHLITPSSEQAWQAEFEEQKRRASGIMAPGMGTERVPKPSKLKKSASRASTRPLLHQRHSSSFSPSPSPFPSPLPSLHWPASRSLRTPTTLPHPLSTHLDAATKALPPRPQPVLPGLCSPSSLSLSSRPRTLFKTWTTITGPANMVPHSESWLASQKQKSKQRTCICWCFWLVLIALVAAAIVTVLVLRAHGILHF
ncbi:hypothetical protein ACEQ8H_003429 [Pleosporales sp. CAS-2024a]